MQKSSATKKKRQRLAPEVRRAQLVSAAQRVFIRKGFHGTKTKDLADEAGVNEATLFLYFKTKEGMFDAAITEPLLDMISTQEFEASAFGAEQDIALKNRIADKAMREMFDGIGEMVPLLSTAIFRDGDLGKSIYQSDVYPLLTKLRDSVSKSIGISDAEESEFIVLAAFSLCFMFHVHHQLMGMNVDPQKTVERIAALFLRGVFNVPLA